MHDYGWGLLFRCFLLYDHAIRMAPLFSLFLVSTFEYLRVVSPTDVYRRPLCLVKIVVFLKVIWIVIVLRSSHRRVVSYGILS